MRLALAVFLVVAGCAEAPVPRLVPLYAVAPWDPPDGGNDPLDIPGDALEGRDVIGTDLQTLDEVQALSEALGESGIGEADEGLDEGALDAWEAQGDPGGGEDVLQALDVPADVPDGLPDGDLAEEVQTWDALACGDAPVEGICLPGEILLRCDEGIVVERDCSETAAICVILGPGRGARCSGDAPR